MDNKISVIIPVYKVEKYLHRCVDSVLNQTYSNLEIILVDDGSPDNCGTICDTYEKQDTRITAIHQENKGLSGARNSGMKIATGDYISFVDSDDWLEPDMYRTLISAIVDTQSDMAITDFSKSMELSSQVASPIPKPRNEVLNNKQTILYYRENGFYVWANLYRREVIKDLSFRENIKFVEDMFFSMDVIANLGKAVHVKYPFYNYFIGPNNSLTRRAYDKSKFTSLHANLYIQEKVATLFPEDNEVIETVRKSTLENAIYHLQSIYQSKDSNLDANFELRKKAKKVFNENFVLTKDATKKGLIIRLSNLFLLRFVFR
ncbi:glycosyltransferase [Muricauda sp. SCSIO 64092]|uniref:glycosyltransferase family 2 protein n=1 Tax=Allomuricauda sp. SCSIO 64092 TaxID=2908842 RepID=UPI001FF35F99|nr:glycosyltransferase [Muricauda sp. SCSIO 64092]UOY06094.1 glycosyltransferase [Muricauda sp. SCSIO 64092]